MRVTAKKGCAAIPRGGGRKGGTGWEAWEEATSTTTAVHGATCTRPVLTVPFSWGASSFKLILVCVSYACIGGGFLVFVSYHSHLTHCISVDMVHLKTQIFQSVDTLTGIDSIHESHRTYPHGPHLRDTRSTRIEPHLTGMMVTVGPLRSGKMLMPMGPRGHGSMDAAVASVSLQGPVATPLCT